MAILSQFPSLFRAFWPHLPPSGHISPPARPSDAVVKHNHHAHGEVGTSLTYGADALTTPLADGGKNTLDPRMYLGNAPIPSFLTGRKRFARLRLALDLEAIALIPQTLLALCADISPIRIDLSAGVPATLPKLGGHRVFRDSPKCLNAPSVRLSRPEGFLTTRASMMERGDSSACTGSPHAT